ncbi:hypothetical protein BJY01DRAFT_221063 [Aspergillus pseudoustus]|uniref:Uncharacterized protein n=1 Tax=Aspergillus pseudoustus TaxID=1810923 RepID=A0ABR4JB85_9EURO
MQAQAPYKPHYSAPHWEMTPLQSASCVACRRKIVPRLGEVSAPSRPSIDSNGEGAAGMPACRGNYREGARGSWLWFLRLLLLPSFLSTLCVFRAPTRKSRPSGQGTLSTTECKSDPESVSLVSEVASFSCSGTRPQTFPETPRSQ